MLRSHDNFDCIPDEQCPDGWFSIYLRYRSDNSCAASCVCHILLWRISWKPFEGASGRIINISWYQYQEKLRLHSTLLSCGQKTLGYEPSPVSRTRVVSPPSKLFIIIDRNGSCIPMGPFSILPVFTRFRRAHIFLRASIGSQPVPIYAFGHAYTQLTLQKHFNKLNYSHDVLFKRLTRTRYKMSVWRALFSLRRQGDIPSAVSAGTEPDRAFPLCPKEALA